MKTDERILNGEEKVRALEQIQLQREDGVTLRQESQVFFALFWQENE